MAISIKRLLIGTALLLGVALAAPANAAWPGDNGRIVSVDPRYDWENCEFDEGGHCDAPPRLDPMIVTQDPDGGNRTDLVAGLEPTWDPSGTKVAYVTHSYSIFKINADGTGRRRLSTPYAEPGEEEMIDTHPSWSPDGNRVVFQRTWEGTARKLIIVNVDGSPGPRTVTDGTLPEWSSRHRIAFIDRTAGGRRIFTVRPDGTQRRRVANTAGASDLTWAPGGRKLGFIKPGTDGRECLWVVRVDGTGARKLKCGFKGLDDGPVKGLAWAPNGGSLLVGVLDFHSEPVYSEGHIVRVRLDGSAKRLGAVGYSPDWQPTN